jgi:N-acetylmuramoyl-L-alanine amidase
MRVADANSWGADYFISIHTNASSIPSATGSEAFSFSEPSRAFSLGEDILTGLNRATGLRNRGMQTRTNLYVLRKTTMPAVLVELGFITNPSDAELMNTRPDLFADGIYQGIVAYTGLA